MSTLTLRQLTVGPLQENCWLLADTVSGKAVLVDPGDEADVLLAAVDATGCALEAIWLTHAHFDHVGGVAGVIAARPVPIWLHPADAFFYANAASNAARWGVVIQDPPPADHELAEGDRVQLGEHLFDVWHLPGHEPSHIVLVHRGGTVVLGGDVLFPRGHGRVDLPDADPQAMRRSLVRMAALPAETIVYSGHGVPTTIGAESDWLPR